MSGVNKVILLGHLGRDPEMKYGQTGTAVCRFSLATSEKRDGQERTEWHNITAFGKLAEVAGQYLAKGSQIYLEGRIQTRSWEGKDGAKRTATEIVAASIQFLGGNKGGGKPAASQPKPTPGDDPFSGDFGPPATEDDFPF